MERGWDEGRSEEELEIMREWDRGYKELRVWKF